MSDTAATYTSADIARLFKRGIDRFYDHKETLLARGFPQPLDLPGHPRWSRAEVDAWFADPRRRAMAPASLRPAPAIPANDMIAALPSDRKHWQDFICAHYAAR